MVEYQPGQCNIGRAERRKRRFVGLGGFAAAMAYAAAVLWARVPDFWVAGVLLPLFVGFLGLFQARAGFCVGFAIGGTYDVSEEGTEQHTIEDATARRADVRRAIRLQVKALLAALAVTVVLVAVVHQV